MHISTPKVIRVITDNKLLLFRYRAIVWVYFKLLLFKSLLLYDSILFWQPVKQIPPLLCFKILCISVHMLIMWNYITLQDHLWSVMYFPLITAVNAQWASVHCCLHCDMYGTNIYTYTTTELVYSFDFFCKISMHVQDNFLMQSNKDI